MILWYAQGPPRDTIRLAIRDVFAAQEYQWDSKSGRLEWLWSWFDRIVGALLTLKEHHPAAYYAVLGLLVALLLLVLSHTAYVLWRVLRPHARSLDAACRDDTEVRGPDWYIDQARLAIEQGNYVGALGLRFRALVLRLDRSGAVTFHPSKTPAEYLKETRLDEAGGGVFSGLVSTLYRHLFGGVTCTEGDVRLFDRHASLLESRCASA